MPNIFKNFLRPAADKYILPNADELEVEEEPVKAPADPEDPAQGESTPEEETQEEQDPASQAIAFAQIQAEKILADARGQAEALVQQRWAEAEEEIRQEREAARSDGYRQGYAEGLTQGRVEGQRQLDEQKAAQAQEIQRFLEQATAAREAMMDQTRGQLRDLSIAVAEKVIHISLKSSGEVIARMIQAATEKLKRREWVHIYLADCDAKNLAQAAPELTTALAGLSDHIKFMPMADDEPGTCIIEMPDEIIDASAATQLSNIRDLLKDE